MSEISILTASRAAEITRGVCRLMTDLGFGTLTEFTLATGRRVDVIGLSAAGEIFVVEVKSSVPDFRSDGKWHDYLDYCDRLAFAVAPGFPTDILPEECGLIIADSYQGAVMRDAPRHANLHASRRKAVTLRFGLTAAARLRGLTDPPL
jgi:hypothetical protein